MSTIRTAKQEIASEYSDVVTIDATNKEHSGVHLTGVGYVDLGIEIANM
jgi:hypothetical protein